MPRHIDLRQALALVTRVADAAIGLPNKRRTAAFETGKQKLAIAVIGIGQALQLVKITLQGGGDGDAIGIGHGAAGLNQQAFDVLQHGSGALQRAFFHRQCLRSLRPAGSVLGIQRNRLRHRQRAGGAQRVVGRRQYFGHGAYLLLDAQKIALQRAHGGLALLVKRLGTDAHGEFLGGA